jgi:hypothetical protein
VTDTSGDVLDSACAYVFKILRPPADAFVSAPTSAMSSTSAKSHASDSILSVPGLSFSVDRDRREASFISATQDLRKKFGNIAADKLATLTDYVDTMSASIHQHRMTHADANRPGLGIFEDLSASDSRSQQVYNESMSTATTAVTATTTNANARPSKIEHIPVSPTEFGAFIKYVYDDEVSSQSDAILEDDWLNVYFQQHASKAELQHQQQQQQQQQQSLSLGSVFEMPVTQYWLRDAVLSCAGPNTYAQENAENLCVAVYEMLSSQRTSDDLQNALFELLGDKFVQS